MAQRQIQFANDQYYHILNRGMDKREIFLNQTDFQRFLECLANFNTSAHITIRDLRKNKNRSKDRSPTSGNSRSRTSVLIIDKLVEILCFCLLPNHFHLLVKQLKDGGIREFMRKIGTGYTNYFNTKYERQGHLFQGMFKAIHISKESHLLHITRYIHLNVLDLYMPEWREGKVDNWEKAKEFLENYPWSSYPAFVGKKSLDFCNPGPFMEIFKTPQEYKQFLKEWTKRSLDEVAPLCLE